MKKETKKLTITLLIIVLVLQVFTLAIMLSNYTQEDILYGPGKGCKTIRLSTAIIYQCSGYAVITTDSGCLIMMTDDGEIKINTCA